MNLQVSKQNERYFLRPRTQQHEISSLVTHAIIKTASKSLRIEAPFPSP